jgi:predicted ArsR family transcriptional regulator
MSKPVVGREIEALTILREPVRRALYEHVARQPAAVSRDEAARALGINRALAAFHLDRLAEASLLTVEFARRSGRTGPGAGRPAKLYRRSRRRLTVNVPPRDHRLLATLLAASITPPGVTADAADPARRFGRSLGARARRRLPRRPTAARLQACLEALLDRVGFEPYRPNQREVRLGNCPFDPLSRRHTALVCGVGVALVSGVLDGLAPDAFSVTRDERPDRCCVVLTASPTDVVRKL